MAVSCALCFLSPFLCTTVASDFVVAGGSFGVVYKAIERATGETVAIKHVSAVPIWVNAPEVPS